MEQAVLAIRCTGRYPMLVISAGAQSPNTESYSSAIPERLQLASFGLLFHQPKATILHKLLLFSLSLRPIADYAKAPC